MKVFPKQINKTAYLLCIFAFLILFGLSLVTFHDVQTAQGVGLYYAHKLGYDNRIPFDLLADFIGGFCIIILILLPALLLKKRSIESVFRFSLLFFAMAPFINPASIVHIASQFSDWGLRTAFAEGHIGDGLLEGLSVPLEFLWIEIPLFILIFMINKKDKNYLLKMWKKVLILLSVICLICYFLFPSFGEYTLFIMNYAFLIIIFDETELLMESCSAKYLLFILWGVLGLRGIFRMLDLMQHTHL